MCKRDLKKTVTGVYGGSFNPIHLGHTSMAQEILNLGLVDEIWFIVSPQNPLKNNGLWSDNLRLKLTKIAVKDIEHVEVSDVEFCLPKPNYMFTTLETLTTRHPDREFVLIIGMDNWECFHRWYRWQEILEKYRIIVLPREPEVKAQETQAPQCQLEEKVHFVQLPLINLSSTWIRSQISTNPTYNGEGLNPKVWTEIKLHNQ